MKKILIMILIVLPTTLMADESSDVTKNETKTVQGNWESSRDRAKKSWGWACSDWRNEVSDKLPRNDSIKSIKCGDMRCENDGKKFRCDSHGSVTYILSRKDLKTPQ